MKKDRAMRNGDVFILIFKGQKEGRFCKLQISELGIDPC